MFATSNVKNLPTRRLRQAEKPHISGIVAVFAAENPNHSKAVSMDGNMLLLPIKQSLQKPFHGIAGHAL